MHGTLLARTYSENEADSASDIFPRNLLKCYHSDHHPDPVGDSRYCIVEGSRVYRTNTYRPDSRITGAGLKKDRDREL